MAAAARNPGKSYSDFPQEQDLITLHSEQQVNAFDVYCPQETCRCKLLLASAATLVQREKSKVSMEIHNTAYRFQKKEPVVGLLVQKNDRVVRPRLNAALYQKIQPTSTKSPLLMRPVILFQSSSSLCQNCPWLERPYRPLMIAVLTVKRRISPATTRLSARMQQQQQQTLTLVQRSFNRSGGSRT